VAPGREAGKCNQVYEAYEMIRPSALLLGVAALALASTGALAGKRLAEGAEAAGDATGSVQAVRESFTPPSSVLPEGVETEEAPAGSGVAEAPAAAPVDTVESALQRLLEATGKLTASKKRTVTALAAYYAERQFRPLWIEGEHLSPAARALIQRLGRAEEDGLDPAAYAVPEPADLGEDAPPDALAEAELALSTAAVAYAQHAQSGRVDPSRVSSVITMKPERVDPAEALRRIGESPDPAEALDAFNPPHEGFRRLRTALAALLLDPSDPLKDRVLTPGMRDPAVALLRQRLAAPAGADPMLFDAALETRVKKFQRSRRVEPTGIVDETTLSKLGGGPEAEMSQILVNMERWRWLPRDLGAKHVFVNIPEFMVRVQVNGQVTYSGRVVVGTRENQTPVFSDEIESVVVNPYWNVPSSILIKEMLPKVQQDPGYLSRRGYEVVAPSGKVVSPYSVNWWGVDQDNLPVRVRQEPSEANALGKIKFLFPNEHSVYLHDTPQQKFFAREERAFSHGCVRVHEPMLFADALLQGEPNISSAKIESLFGDQEKWLALKSKVPVHLAYFTAFVGESGSVERKADIYGHDSALAALMGLEAPLVAGLPRAPAAQEDAVAASSRPRQLATVRPQRRASAPRFDGYGARVPGRYQPPVIVEYYRPAPPRGRVLPPAPMAQYGRPFSYSYSGGYMSDLPNR